MKWLKSLFSRDEEPTNSRIYTVGRPPVRRAPPRPRMPRQVPEPDPVFGDTGSLELREERTQERANPYDTSSWQLDPEQGLRRVDDDKTVRRDRGHAEPDNPYNTGAFRKGW